MPRTDRVHRVTKSQTWLSMNIMKQILKENINILKAKRASFVAQLVKNLYAMWETWVEKKPGEFWPGELYGPGLRRNPARILAWRIIWTVHGVTKSWTWLSDFLTRDKILRQHKRNNLKRYGKNKVKDI